MGYGGNLIWTSVFKTLSEDDGNPVAPVHMPLLSDLLNGRLYNGAVTLKNDVIFRHNPRLVFPECKPKGWVARILDNVFVYFLQLPATRQLYELLIFRRCETLFRRGLVRYLHVDMRIHSYAQRIERRRIVWKTTLRAADAVLSRFSNRSASLDCELYFTEAECLANERMIQKHGLSDGFVVIEPGTNRDYFGELRSWPNERWESLIQGIRSHFPQLQIVQTGLPDGEPLSGVLDLRGKTDFRGAALLLQAASLFIGTEGGLMHAANAVGTKSLILWGGVTLPEFAGYPTRQLTICKYVSCAPCGRRGLCDKGHICMRHIEVSEVETATINLLILK
jgi:ADP-heptose:LPS heptosyltransferase